MTGADCKVRRDAERHGAGARALAARHKGVRGGAQTVHVRRSRFEALHFHVLPVARQLLSLYTSVCTSAAALTW